YLLAWPYPCDHLFDRPFTNQGRSDVDDPRRGHLRHIRLTGTRITNRGENSVCGVVETKKKARHLRGCDRHRAALSNLLVKQWNDRAPRCQDVPVPHAYEPRTWTPHVRLD